MKKTLLLISVTFSFLNTNAQVASPNGIVSSYSFTGNANDDSGNNQNGTVNGATLTTDRFGNANSAYSFNGSSDYIELPASNLTNNTYTYSFWAKPFSIPASGSQSIAIDIGSAGGDQFANFVNNVLGNNGWSSGVYNNGSPTQYIITSQTTPTANVWSHITVVRKTNQLRIFLNGQFVDVDSSSNNTTPYYGSGTVRALIGMRFNSTLAFYGAIDDLIFYNRAVADSEVVGLYNNHFLGQQEVSKNNVINIFPNPTQNELNISSTETINKVEVLSILGQVLKSNNGSNRTSANFNISEFSKGTYLVNIYLNNGTIQTRKILKN